jgi:FtsP/CotA-like multicopper oxidase with cupredoxin domain
MLAFNNQHPGPLIKVKKGVTIFVNFTNETSLPTAVHWHGVRLDNRYDGVPGLTQEAVQPGQTFRYQIYFKDAGIYWYHPHHREDLQQELGLAGNILVTPISADYYSPVNREEIVMLDDLVLTDTGITPFGLESSNYMLMGRFGNFFITNGEPEYSLETNAGEVVRFHFTNASNTRTFNISFRSQTEPDASVVPIKVVGSDVGKLEHEVVVESIVLAPAERYIVEVLFDDAGSYELTNHVQGINHRMGVFLEEISILGTIRVSESRTAIDHHQAFETLRTNLDVIADIDRYRSHFDRPVDHELVLTLEVDSLPPAIEQSMLYDWVYFNPVEWTGTMPVMNWATTGTEVEWILRDTSTGDENMEVNWTFQVDDVVKIRIHNDRGAFHSMQHPLHIHGQRFLILEQNGVANNNLVWKDTVLLPAGSSTDILLELSNPGRWMVHCHIAEHLESGMKFVLDVEGN